MKIKKAKTPPSALQSPQRRLFQRIKQWNRRPLHGRRKAHRYRNTLFTRVLQPVTLNNFIIGLLIAIFDTTWNSLNTHWKNPCSAFVVSWENGWVSQWKVSECRSFTPAFSPLDRPSSYIWWPPFGWTSKTTVKKDAPAFGIFDSPTLH